eukprot:1050669-Prymnesium_polylepis.2
MIVSGAAAPAAAAALMSAADGRSPGRASMLNASHIRSCAGSSRDLYGKAREHAACAGKGKGHHASLRGEREEARRHVREREGARRDLRYVTRWSAISMRRWTVSDGPEVARKASVGNGSHTAADAPAPCTGGCTPSSLSLKLTPLPTS